jgi:hypothetical protein
MSASRLAVIELVCTVVLPLLILQFGTSWFGPVGVAVAAGAPAAAFVVAQMARDRAVSALGVLALTGVALSGLVALLRLDGAWFAWKEGLLPVVLGLATAASARTSWPVIGVLFDKLLDPAALARIRGDAAVAPRYAAAVRRATVELAVAAGAPGLLAFGLARLLVTAPGGTPEYAEELSRYTAYSIGIVTVPGVVLAVMALRRAFTHVETAVGVEFESLLPELTDPPSGSR